MRTKPYLREFENERAAESWMRMKNQVARDGSIFCLVAGTSGDNFAVVDSRSAIELGLGYRWEK
jgi:hypothetical protein